MTERAVRSFLSQTYPNKMLLVFDTGLSAFEFETLSVRASQRIVIARHRAVTSVDVTTFGAASQQILAHITSIGELRNLANELCCGAQIIAHWDSDDWSYPFRLEDQVKVLEKSGVAATGYSDMVFQDSGKAWLYQNGDPQFCLGTSLCYWRATWANKPFEAINEGEDNRWLRQIERRGVSSVMNNLREPLRKYNPLAMVAGRHEGNTVKDLILPDGENWTRKPEWDESVSRIMDS